MDSDTLDALLLRWMESFPNEAQRLVIADCLEEMGHAAGSWFRAHSDDLIFRSDHTVRIQMHVDQVVLFYATDDDEPGLPGIADLNRRLDVQLFRARQRLCGLTTQLSL